MTKTTAKQRRGDVQTILLRLSFFLRIVRNKILGKIEPLSVCLTVNNRCNFNCIYCFGDYNQRRNEDFTLEELKRIVDELRDMGCRHMVVHGGETLLRKDIGEVTDYIRSKGIFVGMVINGSLLAQKIDEIRNVDSLCISLDGAREGNDRNRGKGTHDIALGAIRLAKREGFRLRVQATLTKYTKDDIGYLAELAKEIGFELQFSILYKPLKRQMESALDDDEVRLALATILSYKKRGYPVFTSAENLEHALRWPHSYSRMHLLPEEVPAGFRHIRCAHGKQKFVIDADGRVVPCVALNEEFPALNLKEVGLKKALDHVVRNTHCVACPHLTDNDYNLLFNLSWREILEQVKLNLMEIFQRAPSEASPASGPGTAPDKREGGGKTCGN